MKKVIKVIIALIILAIIVFGYLIYKNDKAIPAADAKHAVNPNPVSRYAIDKPKSNGEYIARAADCIACHTAKDGFPFAGGLALNSPFGAIYSTNITPDKATGIGNYSLEDFSNAVRKGVRKDGEALYPAMPYTAYRNMTDADIKALYDFFMNDVKPVHSPNQRNGVGFPFNQRWGLSLWQMVGLSSQKPADLGDKELNRGAYLAETLAHCGTCHTPRNLFFAEKGLDSSSADFISGAPLGDWYAPNVRKVAGQWTQQELAEYLATGRNDHTSAVADMSDAVNHSLQYLSDEDMTAMTKYLKHIADKNVPALDPAKTQATATLLTNAKDLSEGAQLYANNCMGCHFAAGQGAAKVFPKLDGNELVNAKNPYGLLHVILHGARLPSTIKAPAALAMPGFAGELSDEEAAALATFVRSSWNNNAPAATAADAAKARK